MALEWVEIIEPRTKERMYANLTTGECAWEPPPGVAVKKSDENQWWELFDVNTSRFYYYNAMSGKTVWHRPRGEGSDIIPLAKLQTLKLNEETSKQPQKPKMVCTETQTSPPLSRRHFHPTAKEKPHRNANSEDCRRESRETTPRIDEEARRAEVLELRQKSGAKESKLPPPGFLVNLNARPDVAKDDRRREMKENGTATMSSSSSLSSPSRRLGGGGVGRSCSFLGRGGGDSSSGGRRSVESTPLIGRRKDSQGATAASSGAESLCTPLLFRRQMSQDTPQSSALGFSPVKRQGVVLTSGNKQMAVIAPNNACSVNSLRPSRSLHSGLKDESGKKKGKEEQASGGPGFYANIDPRGAARNIQQRGESWEDRRRQQKQQQLLQEFYLRQHELTGYRFVDGVDCDEEGSDRESEEEEEARRRRQRRNLWKQQQRRLQERQETRGRRGEDDEEVEDEDEDSDEDFADDEGSSREYLNEDAYPEDERETYAALLGKMQQQMQLQDKPSPDVVDHPQQNQTQDHHIYSPVAEVPLFCPPPVSSFASFSPGAVGRTQAMAAARQEAAASSEGRAEKYVKDNLNVHKRGLFRRNVPIKELLSWSKEGISQPLLVTPDKTLRKFKKDLFKLIQIYMSDRKAKAGATLSSVAHEIVTIGWKNEPLRDELFFLLCKQTTENPRRESLRRGWELMAISLAFFSPTTEFEPYLTWYIEKHRDPELDKYEDVTKWPIHVQISHYATVSQNRLEKLLSSHLSSAPREPVVRDVDRARVQIFRPTMFGSTLEEVMVLQKERFPERKLPWVIITLVEEVIRLGGEDTIGIFREAPDHRDLENTQELLDRFQVPAWTSPLIPASLLKRFFADLHYPLIPPNLLRSCGIFTRTSKPSEFQSEMATILSLLPPLNRLVLAFLISFLQRLLRTAERHKMTAYNLAVVFTPNLTRMTSSNPLEMQEEALKANAFFQFLLEKMDAKFAENLR